MVMCEVCLKKMQVKSVIQCHAVTVMCPNTTRGTNIVSCLAFSASISSILSIHFLTLEWEHGNR